GILDPVWNHDQHEWLPEVAPDFDPSCGIKRQHKGILFHDASKKYLSTQALACACDTITRTLGHKLALIGMDACRMAMLEVAYELAPYGEYLVGSQDCELEDGWDFIPLINRLAQG